MATSTLLQYLESTQQSVFGGTVAVGPDASNRSQTEIFIARETLAVGDLVAFDYAAVAAGDVTLGIFKADGNSTPVRTPFGVVVASAENSGLLTAGSAVKVCISGVAPVLVAANATGSDFPLGTLLQVTNNAGEAGVASAASAQPICAILAQVQPNGAGAQLRRCVIVKQF